jgi:RimJ/RimL family protein N-acetyltransferase
MGWHIAQGPSIGHWVAERIKGAYFEAKSSAIGLLKDEEIVAGVIYENWNGRTITCHIAIETRLTKSYLKAIFDYPFNICQVEKIIVPVAQNNHKSLKLVKNMGFNEEARIKDATPEGDMIFLTLEREKCRFLGVRNG